MSLPYSAIVPSTAVVESPAFATEKKHMLLAMTSSLIPSGTSFLEFAGASAVVDFGTYFGKGTTEYAQIQKYFSFLSKGGNAPEKLVVARWYKENEKAFVKGKKLTQSATSIIALGDGSFKISMGGTEQEVSVALSEIETDEPTYSDIAGAIQTGLTSKFAGATCEYSSVTGGFIIKSSTAGAGATIESVSAGTTGADLSEVLGLLNGTLSQGVNAETYADFCDRMYLANTSGYSITTLEDLTDDEIKSAITWLNGATGEQTHNTVVRLVFNIADKERAIALQDSIVDMTGYVVCYDPKHEYVNILDCAICATIDYTIENGAINFNFQPANGYSAITDLGTVIDYKNGLTNIKLVNDLNDAKISFVYSLGFGTQTQVLYGFGYVKGDFGTEDVQVNESALEQNIQVSIINAMTSLNKVKMRGSDAKSLVSSLLVTPLELFKTNGVIASDGKLTNAERVMIAQMTGSSTASDSVEQTGYYYKIYDFTDEDIALRRVRVLICYLSAGVVNKVRIVNKIYGA